MGLHYQAGPAVLDLSSLDQRDWLALQDCQMGLVGKNLVTLPPLPTLHVPYEMFKFSVCKAPCVARWQVITLWMLRCPQLWIFLCHPLMVSLASRVSNCLVISNGASWLILRLFLPRFRLVFLALLPGHASGHCPLH